MSKPRWFFVGSARLKKSAPLLLLLPVVVALLPPLLLQVLVLGVGGGGGGGRTEAEDDDDGGGFSRPRGDMMIILLAPVPCADRASQDTQTALSSMTGTRWLGAVSMVVRS